MTGAEYEFPVARFRAELRRRGDCHDCPVDLIRLELKCRGQDWPLSRVIEALCRAGFRVGFAHNLALVELARDDTIRRCADGCQQISARPADPSNWLPTYDHPGAHGTVN